jgi:tRNA 2-selenouridine synthase
MRASRCVRLETGTDVRVTLLLREYEFFLENKPKLYEQLDCLARLHGREKIAGWKALAERGAWREFVSQLLTEHYDPAYRRSSHRNFTHLAEAQVVRIASAETPAFLDAARCLVEEAVSA